MTAYKVFEKEAGATAGESGGGHWVERGNVEAHSAEAAIQKYVKINPNNGTFAAVSARSFKVKKVKVAQATQVSFE